MGTSSRLAMAARLGAFLAFVLVLSMLLQSSVAAPAEEAAKALRVKRCNFSVSDHHYSQAGWSRNLFFSAYIFHCFSVSYCFSLYFTLFLTVSDHHYSQAGWRRNLERVRSQHGHRWIPPLPPF